MSTKKILVVAAHPDDELLGAGGTLIKHREAGNEIFCLILGEGELSRDTASESNLKKLYAQAEAAGRVAGFKQIFFAHFPDNAFDTVALLSIAKEVEKYLEQINPSIVYTHHGNDLNIDHRRAFEAVLTAARPCNANCPTEIFTFETPSSTEWQKKDANQFSPDCYVDVSGTIETKIKALEEYASEMRPYPHPRSPEGIKILAQYRGLESGLRFAEAFCLIRRIDK